MKKIIIVDDDVKQLNSLRISLTAAGYQVLEAYEAHAVLDILRCQGEQIALIITDYNMPGMDGFTLLDKIREQGHQQAVILMTAYADKKTVVRAIHVGFSGFLEKPFTPDEVLAEIHRVGKEEARRKNHREPWSAFSKLGHQINNLLFIIQGMVELNQTVSENRDKASQSLHSSLSVISKAAEKVMELNNELLSRARNLPNAELGIKRMEHHNS